MNRDHRQPPRLAQWLLGRLFPDDGTFTTVGDLVEEFQARADLSPMKAQLWFWMEIIKALPIALKAKFMMDFGIFINHLKVAVRRLKRDRIYALINTVGLALGLGCFLLMSNYYHYEHSYDAQVPASERIYRIMPYSTTMARYFPSMPVPAAAAIRENMPDTEVTGESTWAFGPTLIIGDQQWETRGRFVDAEFIKLFGISFMEPMDEKVLNLPNTLVLSQSLANRCFGDRSPVGQTLLVKIFGQTVPMTVSNVYTDLKHTHLDFEMMLSLPSMGSFDRLRSEMEWDSALGQAYTRLGENSDPSRIEEELLALLRRHAGTRFVEDISHIRLQALRDIHLNPDFNSSQARQSLILFMALAFIILLVAVINFVNMSMARASTRIKEIAMKKMIGARRRELIRQILGESIGFALIATLIALIGVVLILPAFNQFVSRQIAIGDFFNARQLLRSGLIAMGVGLLAGIYPALHLSAFAPKQIVTSRLTTGRATNRIKQALVVTQFAVSMGLGIASVVIVKQLAFMQRDWGCDRNNIIEIWGPGFEAMKRLKTDLQANPAIEQIALCSNALTHMGSALRPQSVTFTPPGMPPKEIFVHINYVDHGLVPTFGLTVLAGENFSEPGNPEGVLINQCLIDELGVANPIGQTLAFDGETYTILGVLKDFHTAAFDQPIEPSVFSYKPPQCLLMYLRLQPGPFHETIQTIEKAYTTHFPSRNFRYRFMDESIAALYQKEMRLSTLVSVFSGVGIFLACMGLLGLAAYMLERRTKEIGIRKALGASTPTLFVTLTKEFLWMIGLALVIAAPVGFFIMRRWLQGYAYRIGISVWIFVEIGAAAVLLALVTIGVQTLKKTLANPVKALRYE